MKEYSFSVTPVLVSKETGSSSCATGSSSTGSSASASSSVSVLPPVRVKLKRVRDKQVGRLALPRVRPDHAPMGLPGPYDVAETNTSRETNGLRFHKYQKRGHKSFCGEGAPCSLPNYIGLIVNHGNTSLQTNLTRRSRCPSTEGTPRGKLAGKARTARRSTGWGKTSLPCSARRRWATRGG